MGVMAEEDTDKINSVACKKRKCHVLTRLHVSVLFTHLTPVSPCLAQRGSDNQGSTVLLLLSHGSNISRPRAHKTEVIAIM